MENALGVGFKVFLVSTDPSSKKVSEEFANTRLSCYDRTGFKQ